MDQVRPATGKVYDLGDDVYRIIAPNPSPMTYWGTNTYLIGTRGLALIDPGPDRDAHLSAILSGLRPGQHISHIFVTHSHVDHSPLSRRLAQQTGARIYAFGPSGSGRSEIMQKLAKAGLEDAGEGVDPDFETDENLQDKQVVKGDGWTLTALWTPGHLGNHLCFQMGDVIFCGDLVMGWSSSLVSPPDGDLTDFMASCKRLRKLGARIFHAGHGAPIDTPDECLD
ncbi:MAG: MBL fold metallo-hydrolase, partial [Pseudomonadota bacterium]